MSTREMVVAAIEQIAAEQQRRLAPLTNDMVLMDSGLDSLCFAILVARLEGELGVDPFTMAEEIVFPVTLGDFVGLYEHAVLDAVA